MIAKEMVEVGQEIASDLYDVEISKSLGTMGGHKVKNISEYNNSDILQQYLDGKICSIEAIYIAMKRKEIELDRFRNPEKYVNIRG